MKYTKYCGDKKGDCAASLKKFSNCVCWLNMYMPWLVGVEAGHPSYIYRIYGGWSWTVLDSRQEQFNLWTFFWWLIMCSVFIVVQFRSCGELLCVTNVHVIMSADKCKLCNVCFFLGGGGWHSWLSHWATSWKVMDLIPYSVTGIFCWHNPSSHTLALESTQPITKMSTRNISLGL